MDKLRNDENNKSKLVHWRVATTAFYRGAFLQLYHNHHTSLHSHITSSTTWIKGVFLLLLSNITWALWLGQVLKSYPSKLLLTTLQCFLQSFVIALAFARDPSHWKIGWNIRLVSVAYCGPVFLAMTTPLIMVITVVVMSAFILGETITLES
ncbi:hypothetical protein OROMI_013543 [Orobanche minor]